MDQGVHKLPPQAIECEEEVLSALLLDPEVYHTTARYVSKDDFYREAHGRIFDAIGGLVESGQDVSMALLVQALRETDDLEASGGVAYLAHLIDVIPRSCKPEAQSRKIREMSLRRRMIAACSRGATGALDGRDTGETIASLETELAECRSAGIVDKEVYSPSDLEPQLRENYEKGQDRGFSTGFAQLDKLYRIRPGELSIVTGIPGSGKSSFVDSVACNLVQNHSWPFAIFSPENWPPERHLSMLLEKMVRRPWTRDEATTRRMTWDEAKGMSQVLEGFFRFLVPDEEKTTVDSLLAMARTEVQRHKIQGFILDPWNELEHKVARNQTGADYLSEVLSKIRRFAKMNAVHVWIVAHPHMLQKENGGYKPPGLYNISGGAQWYNKADMGICVHRPDYGRDETDIHVLKVKFRVAGSLGKGTLRFCQDTGGYL